MKSLIHVVGVGLGGLVAVAPALHDNLGWNSGSRLQAVYLQGSDNSGYPTGAFYDTKLNEHCSFQSAVDSDGSTGIWCLGPSYFQGTTETTYSPPPASDCAIYQSGTNNYYADSKCSVALAYAPYGSSPTCAVAMAADSVPNVEYALGCDQVYSPPAQGSYSTLGGENRMGAGQLQATPVYTINSNGVCAATANLCTMVSASGDCNLSWDYDWFQVLATPAAQIANQTTVYPPLSNYVKAIRQVNVALDAKGNVIGTK